MRSCCVQAQRKSCGNKGMTLLETVIALSVFMVCAAGIATMIVESKRLSDRARDHYQAINIAKNRLERARNMQVAVLPLLVESNTYLNVNGASVRPEQAPFRRNTQVRTVPGATNLTEVIVIVEIRNRASWEFGVVKEELRTYFTEYQEP